MLSYLSFLESLKSASPLFLGGGKVFKSTQTSTLDPARRGDSSREPQPSAVKVHANCPSFHAPASYRAWHKMDVKNGAAFWDKSKGKEEEEKDFAQVFFFSRATGQQHQLSPLWDHGWIGAKEGGGRRASERARERERRGFPKNDEQTKKWTRATCVWPEKKDRSCAITFVSLQRILKRC